jgi:two-component system, chemotaxis family, protein-glutamate methylesterase/glutaminase
MVHTPVEAILIGASAGGLDALRRVLPVLPGSFPAPVMVVQHLHSSQDEFLAGFFDRLCALRVKEAEDKEPLSPGCIYLGPPNYHLLVEKDRTLSLSTDAKVNHARPSIDVLFKSAADTYGPGAVAIVLTGTNRDGAAGLASIRSQGGTAIVQTPGTAEHPMMPQAALDTAGADYVLPVEAIGPLLVRLVTHAVDAEPR